MSALILKGEPVAEKIRSGLSADIEQFRKDYGHAPTLAVVRVGNPPAAVSYTHSIDRSFTTAGMGFQMHVLSQDANTGQLVTRLHELTRADDVHGVLLQRPLPQTIEVDPIMDAMPVFKDVEGISPLNFGRLALETGDYYVTSTPGAAMEILNYYALPTDGRLAVVVGRSNILGKPMALLLLQANATVVACHTHTQNLAALTRQADLLIAAAGSPGIITSDLVKPGVVIIDFGVNVERGRLIGDVDSEQVKEIAGAITPVPGGTGPVTTALLMRNTVRAAQKQGRQLGTKGRITWLPILKSPNRRR